MLGQQENHQEGQGGLEVRHGQRGRGEVYQHLSYWIGLQLKDFFPDMESTPWAVTPSPYFKYMGVLIETALRQGDFTVNTMDKVTTKTLYSELTSTFPPPKVVYKYDINFEHVWRRLDSKVLKPEGRDVLFSIVNNIIPNRDRLHEKFNMVDSPGCDRQGCGGRQDNVHVFCQCVLVREAWGWIRRLIIGLLPRRLAATSDLELLHLMFGSRHKESAIMWLLGNYVEKVELDVRKRGKLLRVEVLRGWLKERLKADLGEVNI